MLHHWDPTGKKRPPDYHSRVQQQTLSWAMGRPYHEPVIDECCQDFSCCCPELFNANEAERWAYYREKHGTQ